ncbi:MgtC/SapB family protein [Sulfitobacter sp. D35]|uniref:MgtC/SapB family protein n=1 Tax=Sulfitobacter sp. D35 TaxID=3083252 RepID=UPI00296F3F0C|nr:MgtC/SapB family protein [Sulfitobacter sp. D35]MDW4499860.1 MgtC/SapB family protein [Sulfitobacter sp. D35]
MWEIVLNEMSGSFSEVPITIAAVRLLAALALAGVIGFEREHRGKAAGLRTHMLVSMAACLFILVSQSLAAIPFGSGDDTQIDPLRLIEAVTAGVAFLAAGAIFTSGGEVRNITTGAGMWLAGAIGLCCGAGQVPLAALATGIVVSVLMGLRWLERKMGTH